MSASPTSTGFEVCRRIRATSQLPVMFLTARDDEIDRLLGLELGADDYVVKPFSPREVVARVKAILRRGQPVATTDPEIVRIGDDYEVDTRRREARRRGEPIALATREFDLLAFFARNQGIALSRQQLIDGVWGRGLVRRRPHGGRPRSPATAQARRRHPPRHGVGHRLPARMTDRRHA